LWDKNVTCSLRGGEPLRGSEPELYFGRKPEAWEGRGTLPSKYVTKRDFAVTGYPFRVKNNSPGKG